MKYYLGKGTELKKEECKKYKTLDGALKAAKKDESLVVWDETGKVIGSLTDDAPDGALDTNPDGSVNAYDEDGKKVGEIDAETVSEVTGNITQENEQSEQENEQHAQENEQQAQENEQQAQENEQQAQENEQQAQENEQQAQENEQQAQGNEQSAQEYVQEVTGNVKATVICDGALNLRRSAAWGNDNICGRAVKGQYYYVRAIHDVDGKQMIETIDGLFLSGQKEHVAIEKLD